MAPQDLDVNIKKERARAASAACMARKRARLKEQTLEERNAAREADRTHQANHKKKNRYTLANKAMRRRNVRAGNATVRHRLGHLQRPEDYTTAQLAERLKFAEARKRMDKVTIAREQALSAGKS